jgi:hypothetical protein
MNPYLKIVLGVRVGAVLVAVLAPYLIMGLAALGYTAIPIVVVAVLIKVVYEIVKYRVKKKKNV